MVFLKIIGVILIAVGILIPLVQFQAMFDSAHVGMAFPLAQTLLHPFAGTITSWAMPLNIASPALMVAGAVLLLKQRNAKPVRRAGLPANARSGQTMGTSAGPSPRRDADPRERIAIRQATAEDWVAIWPIFHAVVGRGETYCYDPEIGREEALRLWMVAPAIAYIALEDGTVVGTYMLRPNQPSLGAHVANAGFMVAPEASGRGVGRAMGLHALAEAKRLGYAAMQFNCVVQSNKSAVALWQSLGFAIVGTVPQAFRHRTLGLTDVYVMHRIL